MRTLLAATTNPAKLKEIQLVFADFGVTLLSLKDFSEVAPAEETGETFEENAILKAKYYFGKTGVPTLADDGGCMVDALGGLPGVHSHRWLGHAATDLELAAEIVKRLAGVPREKRTARIGGFVAFYDGVHLITSSNFTHGYITETMPVEIEPGFPYRSVMVIPQFGKLYKDLTHEEHEAVNHRRKNLQALKPEILEILSVL